MAKAPRTPKRRLKAPKDKAPRPWWGEGPPPHERWPGVTIEIPATWSTERGRWESHDGRYYFDAEDAERHCTFFPDYLRHHKGELAGQPFQLLDFQSQLLVRPLFGWKKAADGLRRFRTLFLAIPKGNGKSPIGAGLGIQLTGTDAEEGAEVYAAAADKDQAAIVFDTARVMIEDSADQDGDGIPDLLLEFAVFRRAIAHPTTHSKYQVVSADVKGKHGYNTHALIIDEFHAQKTRELYEALHRGTVKRRQPVKILLTTAGDDDESICMEEWDYGRSVIAGHIPDETYLPVIFEAKPDDDWQDPEVWKRVNPAFGIAVKADAIAIEAAAAAAEPRKRNDFLRYHLNRWVSQAIAWLPIEWWDRCTAALPDDAVLRGLTCAGGIDLAQKTDLAAFVALFKEPLEGPAPIVEVVENPIEDGAPAPVRQASLNYRLHLVPFFWLPEETLRERAKQDRVPYDIWRDQGLLTVTEGSIIDYDVILRDITQTIGPRFNLQRGQIGYDPAFASDLAPKLTSAGYQLVEVLQGYKYLSEPSQIFEALLKAGRLVHGGQHRLMRWNVENVSIKIDDSRRIRPVKPKKAAKRIDGVVAALIALNRLMAEPESVFAVDFIGTEGQE